MSSASATFDQVNPVDARLLLSGAVRACNRVACRSAAVGLAVAAACSVAAAIVTMAAAGVVSAGASLRPHVFAAAPGALAAPAAGDPFRVRSELGYRAGPVRFINPRIFAIEADVAGDAPRAVAAVFAPLPADAAALDMTGAVVAPPSGQLAGPYGEALHAAALFVIVEEAPGAAPPAPSRPTPVIQASLSSPPAYRNPLLPPEIGPRTAVYDIRARTVFMPNGDKLEAHSGLGHRRDDPRYANVKNKGPTPPNLYDLKERERLFHGVRAIRLNPVPGSKMFGRDGILAHTYMLGPTGQSLGCVSFKNYNAFLRAYLRGEVDRMLVVPELDAAASVAVAARREASAR